MPEDYENALEWLDGQKTATVTLHSVKLKNRVLKLAEQNPGKVKIVARPDERGQNGFLLAHIPTSWIRIDPPRQIELSEERRAEMSERMRTLRSKQMKRSASKSAPISRPNGEKV